MKKPIKKGDIVKIRLADGESIERIWAIVESVNVVKQELTVTLNNTPISPAFKFGEAITLPVSYVLDKQEGPKK